MSSYAAAIVVVVIGRNEGERLRICLQSVIGHASVVVYVDSGSNDGSVALAKSLGVTVVQLDMTRPFTAARARNIGWRQALALDPLARWVQFVDGDCEIQPNWWLSAISHLEDNERIAVVCGRRRERYPQATTYNQLCDQEWNTPIGRSLSCGGDAMMRLNALASVGGYRDQLIAGEEPELCVRLRRQGHDIWRIDAEMTLHDAAITCFRQWWKRSQRAGHAYAEGASIHGLSPERHWVRETARSVFWGLLFPGAALLTLLLAPRPTNEWLFAAALLLYLLQWLKMVARAQGPARFRITHASLLLLGKFSETSGILQFCTRKVFQRRFSIIEYK